MPQLSYIKLAVVVTALALLLLAEGLWPIFTGRTRRLRHDAANIALGVLNAAVVAFTLASALAACAAWAEQNGFGLLHRLDLPAWAEWTVALLLFDLWMYAWHVTNHKIPLLWRFHQVHHADAELDASSALRFHTGEIALSTFARMAVLPLLGMSIEQLLVYELVLQPIILLHHSNIRFPAALDRALRLVIVTPRIHWVHHSKVRREADSNYGSVLNWWDRVFRTLSRKRPEDLQLGLDYTGEKESHDLGRMMAMPFRHK